MLRMQSPPVMPPTLTPLMKPASPVLHFHRLAVAAFIVTLSLTACVGTRMPPAKPTSSADALTTEQRQKIDALARDILRDTGVPGASLAIVRDDRIVYTQAYGKGRLEPPTPAQPAMRYGIGSISKQFTATAVLLLAEEGKLSLDEPIAKYLPDLTRAKDITLRHLLSHTSGYQDFWPQDYVMPSMLHDVRAQQILDGWARKPLDFEPGAQWQYSNTGYTVAGAIVGKSAACRSSTFCSNASSRRSACAPW